MDSVALLLKDALQVNKPHMFLIHVDPSDASCRRTLDTLLIASACRGEIPIKNRVQCMYEAMFAAALEIMPMMARDEVVKAACVAGNSAELVAIARGIMSGLEESRIYLYLSPDKGFNLAHCGLAFGTLRNALLKTVKFDGADGALKTGVDRALDRLSQVFNIIPWGYAALTQLIGCAHVANSARVCGLGRSDGLEKGPENRDTLVGLVAGLGRLNTNLLEETGKQKVEISTQGAEIARLSEENATLLADNSTQAGMIRKLDRQFHDKIDQLDRHIKNEEALAREIRGLKEEVRTRDGVIGNLSARAAAAASELDTVKAERDLLRAGPVDGAELRGVKAGRDALMKRVEESEKAKEEQKMEVARLRDALLAMQMEPVSDEEESGEGEEESGDEEDERALNDLSAKAGVLSAGLAEVIARKAKRREEKEDKKKGKKKDPKKKGGEKEKGGDERGDGGGDGPPDAVMGC
ncbi:hypothetical protein HDV00_010132 [Rhizophlyctis rosea]|nr:hypothetical protein HDV00_010132 [Rhizophlyctis rosea]